MHDQAAEDDQRRAWFRREILPLEPMLRRHAVRFCHGEIAEAEDLVHEAFARLIVCRGWRDVDSPAAFAARTLRNLALNSLRRRKVVNIDSVADAERLVLVDDAPGPEEYLIGREDIRLLVTAISSLPPQCRKVFTLRKVYGLSPNEIAVRLNLSVSTVEKHITKGLRACSERLGRAEARSSGDPVSNPGASWRSALHRKGK